jgi:hypothetical protein
MVKSPAQLASIIMMICDNNVMMVVVEQYADAIIQLVWIFSITFA